MTDATAVQDGSAASSFLALDWAVLLGYFGLLIATGIWFARRKQKSTGDYFLGGRNIPMWAVAVSILATSLSAATFIGGPQLSFGGDLTYLSTNIGMVLAAFVVAFLFIPAFYRHKVSTVYQLLDVRYGPAAKQAASGAFMLGRVMASGARLFMIGLPASLIVFGEPPPGEFTPDYQVLIAIGALTVVGIVYTLAGGISSVIWSDVIQTGVFLAAVLGAIALLLMKIPVGAGEIVSTLREAEGTAAAEGTGYGKLTIISLSTDREAVFTLWTALIAFTLMGVASYGTDQDMVQRMLTCKSAARGGWSVISANIVAIPIVGLFLVAGLLMYIFYARPDIMGEAAPGYAIDDDRTVFLSFILREMPAGMTGLMMAGLFAAGLSSLNSGINSMSSTFVCDFYRPLLPGRSERHYLIVGRLGVAAWGVILGGFACVCVYWQRSEAGNLIDFALGVMTFAYAGLLGVYFTALTTKRGSQASVIAALVTGFVLVALMQNAVWARWTAPLDELFAMELAERPPAFGWRLTIAAAISMGVCMLGGRRARPENEESHPPGPTVAA